MKIVNKNNLILIRNLLTIIFVMFSHLICFFVSLWQKTRFVRSFFLFSECRFYPSCSEYFCEAIKTQGLMLGLTLSVKRLLRCHPLCKGGIDEVPGEELWT